MEKVVLGNTGLEVSRFGLGCMRFPENEAEAIEMVRYALDHDVNYLDTAYIYEESETIVGKALQDGYRQKAVLATKCPIWRAETPDDFERFLDEELLRLKTDVIDIYLLHDVNIRHWDYVERLGGMEFLDRMVKKGKIRHGACSFHGPYEHFQKVINAHNWDMVQIQLGLLDEKNQAGLQGLMDLSDRKIPAVIMEPLRGGALARYIPREVAKMVKKNPRKWSLVEWAFRYLIDKPQVSVVLSGTTTLEQLKDNIRIFSSARPGHLTEEDLNFIGLLQYAFYEAYAVPCTGCKYCLPCPANVAIPDIFSQYNMKKLTHHWVDGLLYQKNHIEGKTDASQCTECGHCEQMCPQEIPIIEKLKEAHKKLGGGVIR